MNFFAKIFSKRQTGVSKPEIDRRPLFVFSGGTTVTPDTCMEIAAYYRGVIYIATQIAKLPWESKDADNRTINDDITYLLKTSPNPEMSSFMFRLTAVIQALNYGNFYAEIERDIRGRPKYIWPIDPSRVCVERSTNGQLYYRVAAGDVSRLGYSADDVILLPKDIFHIRNFHTLDGIVGQNIVGFASQTLGTSLGANTFANALFTNGGLPSGVLESEGVLSDEAYKRLQESWDSNRGGKKTGSTAILEEGTKYKPVSIPPDVLQFLESRKFSVLEIARFLGVPPSKLFDVDVATYANLEQANLEVSTDTLDAWARNFETEADMKLLSGGYAGRKTEMDLYALSRGDMASRSTYFTKMMQNASITPNEIRKKEGMAPYAGGDRYYVATNNLTPQDRLDEVIDSQVSKGDVEDTEEDNLEKELTNALVKRIRDI